MRRRERKHPSTPGLLLSPMIDLIFLLLVFFVVSTMYMSNVQTVPIVLPQAEHSEHVKKTGWTVTVKADGSLYLADQKISEQALLERMKQASAKDPDFSVLIRGEKNASYETIIHLLDQCKGAGITRFSLATEK